MYRLAARVTLTLALILPTVVGAAAEDVQRRDPLRPPGTVQETTRSSFDPDAWRLAYTLVADGRRVAIINDRTVRAGDWVGGARVLAIERGSARLDYRGRKFTIRRPLTRVRKEKATR